MIPCLNWIRSSLFLLWMTSNLSTPPFEADLRIDEARSPLHLFVLHRWLVTRCRVPLPRSSCSKPAAPVGREINRTGDRLLFGTGVAAVGILRNTSIPDFMVLQIGWRAFQRSRCLLACPHVADVGLTIGGVPAFRPGLVRLRCNAHALFDGIPFTVHPLLNVGGSLYGLSQLAAYERPGKRVGRGTAIGFNAPATAAFPVQRTKRGIGGYLRRSETRRSHARTH